MINFFIQLHSKFALIQKADFLAPLALRLYLAPIMWMAGRHKVNGFEDTVA